MDRAGKLDQLIDGAEELLTNLADAHNPAIQELRERVDQAILDARSAIAEASDDVSARWREVAYTLDDYVHDNPWTAVAVGSLAVGAAAFLLGATLGSRRNLR